MTLHPCFIGIDVSKDTLDLFEQSCGSERLPNTAAAIGERLATLDAAIAFVVFEATGSYDAALRRALQAAGLRFARVNPRRARAFARAAGLLAKTDAVDARMLAMMGHALALTPEEPADTGRERLAALNLRRDQLVQMRVAERVRHRQADDPAASLERHLAFLDAEIATLDRLIEEALCADDRLADDARLLRSAPGIGVGNATTLIASMPELGHRSPKAIAALAGLAPLNRDTGKQRGKRHIGGGRRRVRRALYMAAVAAVRTNARLRDFYDRIRQRTASAKAALIAVARKLLIILNAMMRTRTAYQS